MPKIALLADALISKIAAGEVIERPSSVVKELVENSLDAHAKSISIMIEDGGKKEIVVRDDGDGMDEEDCKRCIGRHATSKLHALQDLFLITTMGFRGEALASIASIADMSITSRQHSVPEATCVHVTHGSITKTEKTGAPSGTEICVSSLFAHTPARKKYLKAAGTEAAMVAEVMTRFALLYHQHHFQLYHNKNCILNVHPVKEWIERIAAIYGVDIAKELLPIFHKSELYTVRGFIAKPSFARADRRHQQVYVNGRWIKSRLVNDAVEDAFGRLLFHDRYPVFIIHVEFPPRLVDVNVHPAKKEVRFAEEQQVHDAVFMAVSDTLKAYDLTPATTINIHDEKKAPFIADTSAQTVLPAMHMLEESLPFVIKGVVRDCFFIAEDKHGLMLVDQHAADERVNYELLTEQYAAGGIVTQQLLEPVTIMLPPQDVLLLEQQAEVLKKFGFHIELFGADAIIVRSSPVILGRQQAKELLLDLVTELSHVDISRIDNVKDNIIARMACRKSVKKGDKVEMSEMYAIMRRLMKTKTPYTCPHGRPTIITLSEEELERKFKRCC